MCERLTAERGLLAAELNRVTFDFTALINGLETTHKVRVVTLDGAPWFVAKDVCRALCVSMGAGSTVHLKPQSD
ncbi:hypothetical protein [Rhodoplanes sp. SY1]|uniref:hypothetical protein n=1 Tax=Rhodoplanes sp. SY1 TaxID=3166646 RepID=UPI0038B4F681